VQPENVPVLVRGKRSDSGRISAITGGNLRGDNPTIIAETARLNVTAPLTWNAMTNESSLFDNNGLWFEFTDKDGNRVDRDSVRVLGMAIGSNLRAVRLALGLHGDNASWNNDRWRMHETSLLSAGTGAGDRLNPQGQDIDFSINSERNQVSIGAFWHIFGRSHNTRGIYNVTTSFVVEIAPNYPHDALYVTTYMGAGGVATGTTRKVADVVNAFDGHSVDLRVGVGFDFVSYTSIVIDEVEGQRFNTGAGAVNNANEWWLTRSQIQLGIADGWYTANMDNLTDRYTFGPVSPRVQYIAVERISGEGALLTANLGSSPATQNNNVRTPGAPQNVAQMNVLYLDVMSASGGDTLSRVTISNVEIHPTQWNPFFLVWNVRGPNDNFGQLQLRDTLGITGRMQLGQRMFFVADVGSYPNNEAARGTPRAAWGYALENIEGPLADILSTYNPAVPVIEFSWETGDTSFDTYTLNGVEGKVDTSRITLPFLRDGTWYVPIRLVAELLGADPVRDLTVVPGVSPGSVAGAVIDIPALGTRLTVQVNEAEVLVQDSLGFRSVFLRNVNDQDVAAFIENGNFVVPLRGLSTLLGLTVDSKTEAGATTATINAMY
jgi:hypothetical protein